MLPEQAAVCTRCGACIGQLSTRTASRTGGEKRLLAVVFTKPTVGARVKPTNHDALSRIEMAFGQFEALSWQVGWAIAKIEIGPLSSSFAL